jgi:hypothetical protein
MNKLRVYQERYRTGMPMIIRDLTISVPVGTDHTAIQRKILDTDKCTQFIWDVDFQDLYIVENTSRMTFRITWWFPFKVTKADLILAMDRITHNLKEFEEVCV